MGEIFLAERAWSWVVDRNRRLVDVRAAEVAAAADALKAHEAYLVVGSAPAESALRDAAVRARSGGAGRVETLAVRGAPVTVLHAAVDDCGADLVVVGNVGLNTLTGRVLEAVPQGVARRSKVDVLIVQTT